MRIFSVLASAKFRACLIQASKYFVNRYLRFFRQSGRFAANTWLRTTLDNGVLERVEAVLKRHPISKNVSKTTAKCYQIDDDGNRIKGALKEVALHEFNRQDVERFATRMADEQFMLYQDFIDRELENCTDKQAIDAKLKALYYKLARLTELKGITPPFGINIISARFCAKRSVRRF